MLTWPYMFILSRITLPDSSPNRASTYPALHGPTRSNYLTDSSPDQTSTYKALHGIIRPNYLTRSLPDQASAYPIVPDHLTRFPYPSG
jgi:hypothetical protein